MGWVYKWNTVYEWTMIWYIKDWADNRLGTYIWFRLWMVWDLQMGWDHEWIGLYIGLCQILYVLQYTYFVWDNLQSSFSFVAVLEVMWYFTIYNFTEILRKVLGTTWYGREYIEHLPDISLSLEVSEPVNHAIHYRQGYVLSSSST